jgi:ketosteroid isomerase-like protein
MAEANAAIMTDRLEKFRKEFLNASTWDQRKDGAPPDLLDNLSNEELTMARISAPESQNKFTTMNRCLLYFFFLLPFVGIAQRAIAQPSNAQPSDSAIVSQLNQKWIASYATRDTAAMQEILANDFIIVVPNGKKMDRLSVIRNVGSADVSTTATIDSSSVRVFGNAALVVSYTHFSITANGQTSHGKNCYSDLYVKRNGKWKAVSGHVTLLGN